MEKLFTEAELERLYEAALPFAPEEEAGARGAFLKKAQAVLSRFFEEEENPLFAGAETAFPNRLLFAPLFRSIKSSFPYGSLENFFCPGAFSGWEDAFLFSLEQLFGGLAFPLIEEQAGEMTFPSEKWYREKALPFIKSGAHFKILAKKYPLCARQLIEFTWLQAEHVREIADAVKDELPAVYGRFFPGRPLSRVKSVTASDSDRHNGGRSVHILTFEDGGRLVYKPHGLEMDRAFARWTGLWAEKAGLAPFLFPLCLDTKRGGFCSFIEHVPLKEKADAAVYFYRTGFLLGLVTLMNGNDLHCENIIAAGAEPVLIDTETLLQPPGCLRERVTGETPRPSVTKMAVLPMLLSFPGLKQARYAGLCHSVPGSHNLPVFEGETLTGRAFADEISRGFEKAVFSVTEDIPAARKALEACFPGTRIRSVIRPTAMYGRVLNGLCHLDCQTDPERYRKILEKMRVVSEKIAEEDRERIRLEEREAFFRLDTPCFSETVTKDMLRELGGLWEIFTKETVLKEKERLFFGLKITPPAAGAEETAPLAAPVPETAEEAIRRQAKLLETLLPGEKGVPCAVPREQDDYVVCPPLSENNGMLEGSLGVLAALCACSRALGEEGRPLMNGLRPYLEKLTDPACMAPVLTGSDMSLTGGAAGYLLGCRLCFSMGMLSEEAFLETLALAGTVIRREDRLRYGTFECLYGSYDMIYALSRLPEKYMTPELMKIRACLLENMKLPEEEIITRVKAEMILAKPEAGVMLNNGLRFGNAGALLKGMEKDPGFEHTPRGAALISALSAAEHVLPQEKWPEGYLETGLFHGMPGVTYSLCRSLCRDKVPAL